MDRSYMLVGALAVSMLALAAGNAQAQAQPDTADKAKQKVHAAGTKASRAIEDTAITTTVKAKILAEPGLKVLDISVDTSNGVVTLSGKVDSAVNARKAEQAAQEVKGVKSVNNRLEVRSG